MVGGRQNRVVNCTLLVPAQCAIPLPVNCVDRVPAAVLDAAFAPGESAYPTLRAAKAQHVTTSYSRTGVPVADQATVSDEIAGR